MKRMIALLLVVCIWMPFVCGCSSETAHDPETESVAAVIDIPEGKDEERETEPDPFEMRASVENGLPKDLSFSGTDIGVAVMSDDRYKMDWYSEEMNGERINDLIYQRNLEIGENLDVNLTVSIQYDDSSSVGALQKLARAGDDAYQIVNFSSQYVIPVLSAKILQNLNDMPYIDLDKPWWNQNIKNNTAINGNLYFATGEIAFHYLNGASCMLFNKSLAEDLQIGNVYELVFNGLWTIDKLFSFSESAYMDLNGDTVGDENDQWGLVTDWNASLDAYYAAFDQPLTRLEDGYPTLCANTEKMANITEKVYSLYWENAGVLKHDVPGRIFTGGHSLFINGLIGTYTSYTRDVDFAFGLLPYPKWDESQDEYGTHNRNGYSQYGIPKTCVHTDAASAVLEYACAENYRTIIPAYIGTNLKIKYAGDQETAKSLDIIISNVGVDFAFYSDIMYILREIIKENKGANFASFYSANEKKYSSILENLVKTYAS